MNCEDCQDVISESQTRIDLWLPGQPCKTIHYTCLVKRIVANPRAALSGVAADLYDAVKRMRDRDAEEAHAAEQAEVTRRPHRRCTLLMHHAGPCMPGRLLDFQRPEGRCEGRAVSG